MPEIQNKDQIWRLAEILAFTITGLDKKIQSYWPWDESGSFTDHNYPEIVPLQAELGEIFLTHGIKKFISHGLTKFN